MVAVFLKCDDQLRCCEAPPAFAGMTAY